MKIISWNVNGLRAVYKKGFQETMKKIDPDILCLQEIRLSEEDLKALPPIDGYHITCNHALKKGYSGVAIYSKVQPKSVAPIKLTKQFEDEGRSLLAQFDGFSLLALYIPNGGRAKEFMDYKLDVYSHFFDYLSHAPKDLFLTGDFNIAHEAIDVARAKENENATMFTPVEREQLSKLLEIGYIDTFRHAYPEKIEYTWWANWAHAREKNLGWRIDYVFAPKAFEKKVKDAFILDKVMGSDHCPVGIDLSI
jgi:exodeoxyribonuclease-3